MKFEIRKAKNGWIIECEDPEDLTNEIVGVDEPDEHEGFRTLLWEFLNAYGPTDGKYSKKRLRIVIIPGNSYEGPIDGEYREDLESLRDELNYQLTREANPKWT